MSLVEIMRHVPMLATAMPLRRGTEPGTIVRGHPLDKARIGSSAETLGVESSTPLSAPPFSPKVNRKPRGKSYSKIGIG